MGSLLPIRVSTKEALPCLHSVFEFSLNVEAIDLDDDCDSAEAFDLGGIRGVAGSNKAYSHDPERVSEDHCGHSHRAAARCTLAG